MMQLTGLSLHLRLLELTEAENLLTLINKNREFWSRFEPSRGSDYYTLSRQQRCIEGNIIDAINGKAYNWGVFTHDHELVGDISLYGIKHDPYLTGSIGYSIDQNHVRKGFATEAVTLAVNFAFAQLQLHRIEAFVDPTNIGSIKVLEKVGFYQEGLARKNLKINGVWKDHYLYGLLDEEWSFGGK